MDTLIHLFTGTLVVVYCSGLPWVLPGKPFSPVCRPLLHILQLRAPQPLTLLHTHGRVDNPNTPSAPPTVWMIHIHHLFKTNSRDCHIRAPLINGIQDILKVYVDDVSPFLVLSPVSHRLWPLFVEISSFPYLFPIIISHNSDCIISRQNHVLWNPNSQKNIYTSLYAFDPYNFDLLHFTLLWSSLLSTLGPICAEISGGSPDIASPANISNGGRPKHPRNSHFETIFQYFVVFTNGDISFATTQSQML